MTAKQAAGSKPFSLELTAMKAKQTAGLDGHGDTNSTTHGAATSRALSKALSDAKLEAEVASQQNHLELSVEKQRLESKLALRESSQVRGWLEDMQLSKVCAVFSLQFCTHCYRGSRPAIHTADSAPNASTGPASPLPVTTRCRLSSASMGHCC
jgi:hypothetical protein